MTNNLSPRPPVRVSRLATGAGILAAALAAVVLSAAPVQQPPAAPPQQLPAPSQQPSEIAAVISGDPGTLARYAVPDFIALSSTGGTSAQRKVDEAAAAETAKTLGQVLWDDLDFEQEFYMIPRDTYASVPAARTLDTLPFDAWRELGADAVVFGTVQQTAGKITVQVRLVNVRSRRTVFGKEYFNASNARAYAHTIADEIHQQQRQLRGVARTKLAFVSDRNQERLGETVEKNREVKEIYTSDYDGANQRRITVSRQLNLNPSWSSDARVLAYTSFRPYPDVFLSFIYQGLMQNPTKGVGTNYMPVFSPDGRHIAFMSARDGNNEIYVINVDGSNLRRLTNHPAADSTPTWSPSGDRIAFTSDRTGSPQIYVMGADGSNVERITFEGSWNDRATWSRAPYNEIAYAGRTGAGFDIKVYDVATRQIRQVTFGEGSNESPAYSPSGRHLAFTSTRYGSTQVFTIGRNGRGLRQITRSGNNQTPAWSN